MRKHPAVGTLHRVTSTEYKLPHGGVVPAGTFVIIPVMAFHRDPELFPNPETFDPDRFSEQRKSSIQSGSFLPFGDGPRSCLGIRFGWLQTKLGLAMLLHSHRFHVCPRTRIPLPIDDVSLLNIPKGSVWMRLERIQNVS